MYPHTDTPELLFLSHTSGNSSDLAFVSMKRLWRNRIFRTVGISFRVFYRHECCLTGLALQYQAHFFPCSAVLQPTSINCRRSL